MMAGMTRELLDTRTKVTNLLMLLKLVCATNIDIESGFVQLSS